MVRTMTEFEHTKACLKATAEYQESMAKWKEQWPNYCRNCNSQGGLCYQFDPSPAGVSLGSGYMMGCDPCSECTENGRCARCGKEYDNFNGEDCPHCEWTNGDNEGDIAPYEPECYCWEYELNNHSYDSGLSYE